MDAKICVKCGIEYPLSTEYFGRDRNQPSGFHRMCKGCLRDYQAYLKATREQRALAKRQVKQAKACSHCGKVYPLTAEYFQPKKDRTSGFSSWCRNCIREKDNLKWRVSAEIRERNKLSKRRQYAGWTELKKKERNRKSRTWYAQRAPEIVERRREMQAAYFQSLPVSTRERRRRLTRAWDRAHAAEKQARFREQYARNPMPARLKSLRRRTLKDAAGSFTTNALLQKLKYWGWRCRYCSRPLSLKEVTLDHRIPLAKGGTNWLANIVPACRSCNSRKGAKTERNFLEWLRSESVYETGA